MPPPASGHSLEQIDGLDIGHLAMTVNLGKLEYRPLCDG